MRQTRWQQTVRGERSLGDILHGTVEGTKVPQAKLQVRVKEIGTLIGK